jgi:hypothetical protein
VVAYRQYGASNQQGEGGASGGGNQPSAAPGGPGGGQPGGGSGGGGRTSSPIEPTAAGSGGSGGQSRSPTEPTRSSSESRQPTEASAQGRTSAGGGQSGTQQGGVKLETVLDLIGATVQVPAPNTNSPPQELESPFTDDPGAMASYLTDLVQNTTTDSAETIRGRININQAAPEILEGIPEMTPDIVVQILASRIADTTNEPDRQHATWLLAEGIVTLDQMKTLLPFITGGGNAYRAQMVGYYDEGGPVARVEAVLDATTSPPQLLLWREIGHLGYGYSPETLGVE